MRDMAHSICLKKLYQIMMRKNFDFLFLTTLKTRPYIMDMEDNIVTLPKRGLKTRPYSMDMEDNIVTLPKRT